MSNLLKIKISFILIFILSFTGCVENIDNPTPKPTQETQVSQAPFQLYISSGESEKFNYNGHVFKLNYTSSYPSQIIIFTLDGKDTLFTKNLTDAPMGIYWNDKNLTFTLKPVIWEMRGNQNIPIYENTWNTTELYFEVSKN